MYGLASTTASGKAKNYGSYRFSRCFMIATTCLWFSAKHFQKQISLRSLQEPVSRSTMLKLQWKGPLWLAVHLPHKYDQKRSFDNSKHSKKANHTEYENCQQFYRNISKLFSSSKSGSDEYIQCSPKGELVNLIHQNSTSVAKDF